MVTADGELCIHISPLLGSWPISSRPEGVTGTPFRVSFIKAEPDAELTGTSNSLPQPFRTLMKPPVTGRKSGTQGARAWLNPATEEDLA